MKDTLFELIRYEINNTPLSHEINLSDEDFVLLYKLSKAHDISHLIGDALINKLKINMPEKVKKAFMSSYMMSIYRYEQIQYELDKISSLFEGNKIPFIPLKGSVLRHYYPEPWMRTSCDIDILVHKEDLTKAKELLINNEFTFQSENSHDLGFFSKSNVHLELHFDLMEEDNISKAELPLVRVWDYVNKLQDKNYHYVMSNEMFIYYHIAHMGKHFMHGGCGVRPLIDLYILSNKLDINKEKLDELLDEGKLTTYALESFNLSNVWLNNASHNENTLQMEEYILKGGVYGSTENHVNTQNVKKGGKFKYMMHRIFIPYSSMIYMYPILKKHKWLLPFCEIARWFRIIFSKKSRRKAMIEMKVNNSMDKDKVNYTKNLLLNLNLIEKE